jgi:transcriptional regulator with XRE-family HTH domain
VNPGRFIRVEAPTSAPESPLRLARRHRNWTLERVVSEIDSHLGGSGATASLLSAWERGTRRTSPRYRAALCAIYGLPPETLFAHQDHGRPTLTVVDADQGLTNPVSGGLWIGAAASSDGESRGVSEDESGHRRLTIT